MCESTQMNINMNDKQQGMGVKENKGGKEKNIFGDRSYMCV